MKKFFVNKKVTVSVALAASSIIASAVFYALGVRQIVKLENGIED